MQSVSKYDIVKHKNRNVYGICIDLIDEFTISVISELHTTKTSHLDDMYPIGIWEKVCPYSDNAAAVYLHPKDVTWFKRIRAYRDWKDGTKVAYNTVGGDDETEK